MPDAGEVSGRNVLKAVRDVLLPKRYCMNAMFRWRGVVRRGRIYSVWIECDLNEVRWMDVLLCLEQAIQRAD